MNGWIGKISWVNLNDGKVTHLPLDHNMKKYLGGRGIASRIYWNQVTPKIQAFDPENPLIFMTGPLVATGVLAANRFSVVSKSPMAYPEGYCFGNMGGFFGAELKRAGFDGIVITGRAPHPVYLLIHDEQVELRDASSLWGHGAYAVGERLYQLHGPKIHFLTTGVAGENLVRSAIIFGSHQSTSTAGFGAVMGSKSLKAIVVQGSKRPNVADLTRLKELNRYAYPLSKRVRLSIPPMITATNRGHLIEVIGRGKCDLCGIKCIKGLYRYGQKLEGYRRCQAMEYYLPWRYNREDEPIETLFHAPTLANDYSICTFELQSMIDWLYACSRAGVLTEAETGLPLSKIGTHEFLETLLHSITYRKGFGEILAEGLIRAKEKVSPRAQKLFNDSIAPIGQNDLAPPRAIVAHGLLYPMEPRIHQPLIHEMSFVRAAWAINRIQPGATPVTHQVFHKIAKIFWGSEAAGDLSSYEGKALAAMNIQNRTYLKDSLGLCDFCWPITYSFNSPDGVGDPELEAKFFSVVTGLNAEELVHFADRICIQQRAILLREGRKFPEDDYPLEFNFTQPLQTNPRGQPVIVPGSGDEVVDTTGKRLDRKKFTDMLKEYYHLRGWDEEMGIPKLNTLTRLELDDLTSFFYPNQ